MQFFIKVVFSLCTSLLLLYTSWMRKGKERLKMSDSWFAAMHGHPGFYFVLQSHITSTFDWLFSPSHPTGI